MCDILLASSRISTDNLRDKFWMFSYSRKAKIQSYRRH